MNEEKIVKELKVLRVMLDLTSADLAEILGITDGYVRMIEAGYRRFPENKLNILRELIDKNKNQYPLLKHLKLKNIPRTTISRGKICSQ